MFTDISTIDVNHTDINKKKTHDGVAQLLWQCRAGKNGGRLRTLCEDELANYWLNIAKID